MHDEGVSGNTAERDAWSSRKIEEMDGCDDEHEET